MKSNPSYFMFTFLSVQTVPQFNYACIVWDNCSGTFSNMLENLHLEAIRIILGPKTYIKNLDFAN